MPTRREFLAFGAAGVTVAVLAACSSADDDLGGGDVIEPPSGFDGRVLPIPPILEPDETGWRNLRAQPGEAQIVAGLTTAVWGYNGGMLGPTIRAARGGHVRLRVDNELDEMTTVHWHGMVLPADRDGGPHQPIEPGERWEPEWTIEQPAATLWYHPHPHGRTAEHVYRGLAGFFLIDDPDAPDGLPSAYGVDDVPLVLQDRALDPEGALVEDDVPHYGILTSTMVVNGMHAPTFTATRSLVRFRILDGANARRFNLAFSDDREFAVVAGDAGLLPNPVRVRTASVSPGERLEIVVEFAPGDEVVLQTRSGDYDIDEGDFDLLRIIAQPEDAGEGGLPAMLPAAAAIAAGSGATVRDFELNGTDEINGREMSMWRIDVAVPREATELWNVRNDSEYAHNFHIHGSAFRVLSLDGSEPPAWSAGAKDTVFLPPGSTARLAVEFGRYTDETSPYMFHCHLLRHEDKGMMGQFVVVDPDRVDAIPMLLEPSAAHSH